jgi:peroxiredoxin
VDPNVAAVAEDHQVITVAVNSGGEQEVAAWMRERGLSMPTVVDPAGRLARSYGVRAFPTTFWVDAEGRIQNREVGYTSTLGLRARLWLAR